MNEEELKQPQPVVDVTPKSLDEVIAGLRGFGIEDFAEILTLDAGGRIIQLRISNIPSEDEMMSLMAVEGAKGYLWVQKVKCEILSRSISWINGQDIRGLKGSARVVTDPIDGQRRDVQVVLRNLLLGFGQEILHVLWKVLCVHSQRIEDRLVKSFPDSAIMTEVEKRFLEQAIRDIDEQNRSLIKESFDALVTSSGAEQAESPAPAAAETEAPQE
jgi:hypothetical protein